MHTDRVTKKRRDGRRSAVTALLAVLTFFSLSVAAGAGSAPEGGRISIVTPPDRSVVEGALVSVSVQVPADFMDEVQILVNNRRVRLPKKQHKGYFACFDGISLSYGQNDIRAVAVKGGKKVGEARTSVYYRSDLSAFASAAPRGFDRYLFHDGAEKACTPCHELDFSKYGAGEMAPEKSPCHQCHKKLLTSYSMTHGPAAVWACLSCHDQKATPKLSVVKPDNKMCDNCHENSWGAMKFGHGPTAAGSCATCHDPHASDYASFLRTSPGAICLGCHDDILQKPHVIVGFSNNGHPVRKYPDPYHPGREFSCISCHNPHAGASWTFLVGYDGVSDMSTFCVTCHKM